MAAVSEYYVIPPERRNYIRAYLKESGCSPAMAGYNVLYHVISIAADHPEYSSTQMFEEYVEHLSGSKNSNWRSSYSIARYCFNNAVTGARSLQEFIKEAAIGIADMVAERASAS